MHSIAVIGSGNVGRTLAAALHAAGHRVTMGRRDPAAGSVVDGVDALAPRAAASGAEIVVNAAPGDAALELFSPLADAVGDRILVDVSNSATPGTAAALQRALPAARVVKTLSTMLFPVMAAPHLLETTPTVFVSGDESAAKATVRALLNDLGWPAPSILDLGGIDTATAVEGAFPLAMAVIAARGVTPFALAAAF